MTRPVNIAHCPEHGLHGCREECFVCGGPVEQVPMVPASQLDAHREAVDALNEALSAAMAAVQAFIDGHGPRGTELLPLIQLASRAADQRDRLSGVV